MIVRRDSSGRISFVKHGPLAGDEFIPVSSRYGPRAPITTPAGTTGNFHYGVDFVVAGGAMVIPRFGALRIDEVATSHGFGNFVRGTYDDGPLRGWKCDSFHLDRPSSVMVRSVVDSNAVIGLVGSTGAATGVHLHWQLQRPDGTLTDPLSDEVIALVNGELIVTEPTLRTHTVKAGDTLSDIARMYGVGEWRDILFWTGYPPDFRPESLQVGTVLTVERPPPPVESEAGDIPIGEPNTTEDGQDTEAYDTAISTLVHGAATVRELARDFTEKGGLLTATSEAMELAVVALTETDV